jgi:hypothetical protein
MSARVVYDSLQTQRAFAPWRLCGVEDHSHSDELARTAFLRDMEQLLVGEAEQQVRLRAFGTKAGYHERKNFLMMTRLKTFSRWKQWRQQLASYRDALFHHRYANKPDYPQELVDRVESEVQKQLEVEFPSPGQRLPAMIPLTFNKMTRA